MSLNDTTIITRSEVARLLKIDACMIAVEKAFQLHAEGKAMPPKILGLHVPGGGFHMKAGVMHLGQNYFVVKTNANFPNNRNENGLPTIQGVVAVFDASNGRLLSLMDSIEITIIRTGAATGVAAKYLANKNATAATICGCGNQGRVSLRAIQAVRKLKTVYAYDIDRGCSEVFANEMSDELHLAVTPTDNLRMALQQSDILATCTTSKKPIINKEDIKPGTFIAAVGADSDDKQELHPSVLGAGKLVVDLLEQAATIGELHHALDQGILRRENVHGELGEIIAGQKPGRTSEDEIIIFDSTGTALQDVAAAAIVYEKALATRVGVNITLAN
jgi:alanine dehydrogenase